MTFLIPIIIAFTTITIIVTTCYCCKKDINKTEKLRLINQRENSIDIPISNKKKEIRFSDTVTVYHYNTDSYL